MRTETIILPGIGGSGRQHWQTRWKERGLDGPAFQPSSWDEPDLEDWIRALDLAVGLASRRPMLIAHSLACLLVAHWAARKPRAIAGAFLVAVPDPASPAFPRVQAPTFCQVATVPLPFPALIIASEDDPYGTANYAQERAAAWNAELIMVGKLGHINVDSGLGDWDFGAALFAAFRAGIVSR